MKGIKLARNGDYEYIISASGKRARAKKLEVGKTYLHQNLRSLRKITEITLTTVIMNKAIDLVAVQEGASSLYVRMRQLRKRSNF